MKGLKNIFFASLGLIAVGLFVFLFNDIYQENKKIQRIKGVDAKVIQQLQKIRIVQEAYLSVNKEYANSWMSITEFLEKDQFHLIQSKETIKTENGEDKISVEIDTLASILVFDSLKTQLGFQQISDIPSLWRVPVSDTIFTIRADKLPNGQAICEVRDPFPVNPKRQKEGSMKPLQIGSLEISTLQGNWE